jgi:DNA polymerase III delta subunit
VVGVGVGVLEGEDENFFIFKYAQKEIYGLTEWASAKSLFQSSFKPTINRITVQEVHSMPHLFIY